MASKKIKTTDAFENLWNAFQEEINDVEIPERFKHMQSAYKSLADRHNETLKSYEILIAEFSNLDSIILQSAKAGMLHTEAIERSKKLESEIDSLTQSLNKSQSEVEYEKDLIKKYVDWSDRKLFVWWKSLKAINEEIKPWIDFKQDYKDLVF
jgi:hypothetical protein